MFFFQAEDGIRDYKVTGVQTCALPIYAACATPAFHPLRSVTGDRFLAAATRLRHTDTHGRRFTYCRSNTRTSCCVSKNAKVCAFLIVMTIPSSDTTAV